VIALPVRNISGNWLTFNHDAPNYKHFVSRNIYGRENQRTTKQRIGIREGSQRVSAMTSIILMYDSIKISLASKQEIVRAATGSTRPSCIIWISGTNPFQHSSYQSSLFNMMTVEP
jgi:hypothetical protein